jgi:hypothetical protein
MLYSQGVSLEDLEIGQPEIGRIELKNPRNVWRIFASHYYLEWRPTIAACASYCTVGFKVAAKIGQRYLDLLEANEGVITKNVTENLYDRHIVPVFLGRQV